MLQIAIFIAIAVVIAAGVAISVVVRKRRTARLRNQFGGAEYTRAVREGGSQQKAEAALDGRTERVERLHIRPLGAGDRARFIETWGRVQAPVGDFEQRAADISVDHPLVLENYRAAHDSALRQARGQASTEDLRQAMIHYRTLFEELVVEPEMARAQSA